MGRRGYGSRRTYGYGYSGYHGRSKLKIFLIVVAVILALVLLGMVGLLVMQEKWLVYSPDGPRLDIPFLREEETLPPQPTEPLEIVVVTTAPTPTPAPTPAPTPTPKPEPPMQGVGLLRGSLKDGTAAAKVAEAGGNAAVFNMKADDGTLGYVSGMEVAAEGRSTPIDKEVNDAIRALNESELYTVARVSCFRDNTVPYNIPKMGVKTRKDHNWRDAEGNRWMNPAKEEVRAYVVGVCRELAALGFDEILLDNAWYPTEGKLGNIRQDEFYDPAKLEPTIAQFYLEVKEGLKEWPEVKLSIRTSSGVILEGVDAQSGQSAAGIAAVADRVWLDQGEEVLPVETAAQKLVEAGMERDPHMVVPIGTAPTGAAQDWALLTE